MPHVCGDEPDGTEFIFDTEDVCPTYVGMNRLETQSDGPHRGMPHVCGDEPYNGFQAHPGVAVCPTYVGMNR